MSKPVNIMNKLKSIVDNLNEVLHTDHNLSSFDAIRGNDLLNIVVQVLRKFEILDEQQISAPLAILSALKAIKYIPEENITPDAFRSGLTEASKDVIYPILIFLLGNEANIRKRFYLSKYVTMIEVPAHFFTNDEKMQKLYQSYESTIDKFWMIHSENIKEENFAKEASELEEDIFQMKNELSNLEKRIDMQYNKADLSEDFLQKTRELLKEKKKHANLIKQLQADKTFLQREIDTIRNYNRRDKTTKLEDLLEKAECYADAQQVYAMTVKDIIADLKIIEKVAKESCDDDLQPLEEELEMLQQSVHKLNKEKQQDDAISTMQNTQRILAKRKSLLSKQVLKIRLHNDQVLNKIDEFVQILGGEILRGKTFKSFVGDLKNMCNIYKKFKLYMKSMENEEIILNQTLTELYTLEPNLKYQATNTNNTPEEIRNLSLDDIRFKTMKLNKEQNVLLRACYEEERKYQKVKDMFSDNLIQFDKTKHVFNQETDNSIDYIDQLNLKIEEIEALLEMEKEDLKEQERESEQLQDNLMRYSQMFIDNAGDVSTQDLLKRKLAMANKTLNELHNQMDLKKKASDVLENEKNMTKGVIILISEGKMQI